MRHGEQTVNGEELLALHLHTGMAKLYPHDVHPSPLLDVVKDGLLLLFFVANRSWLQGHMNIRSSGFAFRQVPWIEYYNPRHDLVACQYGHGSKKDHIKHTFAMGGNMLGVNNTSGLTAGHSPSL